MQYGLLFLVLGGSLAGLGALAGGTAWTLAWPALSRKRCDPAFGQAGSPFEIGWCTSRGAVIAGVL